MRPAARVAGHVARREYPAVLYAVKPLLQKCDVADDADDAATHRAFEILGAVALALPTVGSGDSTGSGRELAGIQETGTARSAAARLARAAMDFAVLAGGADDPDGDGSGDGDATATDHRA